MKSTILILSVKFLTTIKSDKHNCTIINFSTEPKVLISTGFPLNSGNKTEVIDLENSNVKCKDLEDFPIENSQPVYANLASQPIICGGWFWIHAALQYPVRYVQLF